MDSLVRKIEIPIARNKIQKAGLYLVPEQRLDELAEIAADAYQNYPLHNWFTNGVYDPIASKLIMKTTLVAMKDDAVIYADSEELNGFAVWVPLGFTGSKTLPFLRCFLRLIIPQICCNQKLRCIPVKSLTQCLHFVIFHKRIHHGKSPNNIFFYFI